MKTNFNLILVFLGAFIINTNAQNTDCTSDFSLFVEYAKTKNYEAAYTPWSTVRKNCPSYHNATFIYGEKILKSKIENSKDKTEKETWVKDLVKMYDEFDTNFPDNNKGNLVNKAMIQIDNEIGSIEEHYALLDAAFTKDKKNFTSAKALYAYFSLFVDQYTAGNKGVELQQVFDKYDEISEKLEEEAKTLSTEKDKLILKQETEALSPKEENSFKALETNIEAFETVIGSMDAKISLLSSCDRLIPFYQKSFESKKTDVVWLQRAAQRLDAKGCSGDAMFTKISEALHKLNPSARSAYNLGIASRNAKNTTKAIEYFNQAADLQTDSNEKAKVYYQIATMFSNSNKSQSRTYAKKALTIKPSYGRAYLLIAQLYASSANDCGETPFEKRAVNWLAAQMAQKAGQVDSSLKGQASSAAATYLKIAPSKADIFQAAMQGKTINFKCWIGESVRVPNL